MATSMTGADDRAAALKEFDETKTGVKGLVDCGITFVPPIFLHPNLHPRPADPHLSIPTIDLSAPRHLAVDLICAASRDRGFFQLVNHGISAAEIDRTISAAKSFHELPAAARSPHYSRSAVGGVSYFSNLDLFRSEAASWRDTLLIAFGPGPPDTERIAAACREELVAWDEKAKSVAARVMAMMGEGLGLGGRRLEEMTCLEGRTMAAQYYPPCPEPDRTLGIADHTDPSVLTVLIQDQIGGLQVKKKSEEDDEEAWVEVQPIPGAIVINVGDLLQIISNDEYKSIQHRVVANSQKEGRVSISIFFNPGTREESNLFGPLPELSSAANPARYRNFQISEFLETFFNKELNTKSLIEHFRLSVK